MKKIGWIGVGLMGNPMANRLLAKGYEIVVLHRASGSTDQIIADGAIGVDTVAEMAEQSDYIFTMICDPAILIDAAETIRSIGSRNRVKVLVDMSTLSPDDSIIAAKALDEAGTAFLRAPVTGSVTYAKDGTLGIMVSGPSDTIEEIRPVFEVLGNRMWILGSGEESRYYKVAINMMLSTIMESFAEAIVFGEKAGLDYDMLIDLIADSAAAAPTVKYKSPLLKARDFSPMSAASNAEKDNGIFVDLASKLGAAVPTSAYVRQLYASMKGRGMDRADLCAILLLLEEQCGLHVGDVERVKRGEKLR